MPTNDDMPTIDSIGRKYGIIASPYPTYDQKNENNFRQDIQTLILQAELEGFVAGYLHAYPTHDRQTAVDLFNRIKALEEEIKGKGGSV